MRHKAVALLSGGLDSTLAILVIQQQGFEVQSLKFVTPFECVVKDRISPLKSSHSVTEKFGFDVIIRRLDAQFLDIVKNPKHGYGKNMNPCIDCRILMLKKARTFMEETGASFIVTGEVLGQRPMSQRKDILYHIDKEADVAGLVVRPLSAKLLKITKPEAEGIIDREKLYDLNGRSRSPQMALAEAFGLTDYPSPAGGCLLTEPNYAYRLKDLLMHNPCADLADIALLKIGRHFRFSSSCTIIIGRDKNENALVESLSGSGDYLLRAVGYGSPVTLVRGNITAEALGVAASLCARYSDGKGASCVEVEVAHGEQTFSLVIPPAGNEIISALRIEKRKAERASTV
jgi:tRNA-specific 2-thiouridylase